MNRLIYLLVTVICMATVCHLDFLHAGTAVSTRLDIKDFSKVCRNGARIIHLPSGIYDVSKTLALPSNTVLEGEGSRTILRVVSSFSGSRFITNTDFRDGNANITVRSLKVEFNLPILKGDAPGVLRFENVKNLLIEDLTMEIDTDFYGIDLSANIRSSSVQRCKISNKGNGGGIMVRNRNDLPNKASDDITVRLNTLLSSNDEPLAVFGWLGMVRRVLIEKNHVLAYGAAFGIAVYGIDQPGHTGRITDVSVIDNTVKGGRLGGIAVKGGARRVSLSNNIIEGQYADGLFLHRGGNLLPIVQEIRIHKNIISNARRHCIFASGNDIVVENNKMNDCGECGIFIAGKVLAVDNVITNAKPGILVTGDSPKKIRGNILNKAHGIRVLNNDFSGIEENIIR
ncbi:MAG: right-handed parallel beta-helix repeat-containing protein [Smithella sp.]